MHHACTHITPKLLQLAIGFGLQRAGPLERADLQPFSRVEGKVAAKVINVDRLFVRPDREKVLTFFADQLGYCAQK